MLLPVEEREVVNVMIDLLTRSKPKAEGVSLEDFAHLFGTACYLCRFQPDNEAYVRIRTEVSFRVSEMARIAGQLAAATKTRRHRWR